MRIGCTVVWCCLAPSLAAQETASARLRLLPLGEPPPFRQEVRDGMRRELDPPAGSVPPRRVEAESPAQAAEGAGTAAFPLVLGSPGPSLTVMPSAGKVRLREPDGRLWLELPCAPGSHTLAVIWRPGKDWAKAEALALPELGPSHDPRSFRFVNVAPQAVGIVFGESRYQLRAGTVTLLSLPEKARGVSVTVLFSDPKGALKPCFSGLAEARDGAATQFFVHRADGDSPRRPIAVTQVSGPLRPGALP
jgi:hypothetical protein